ACCAAASPRATGASGARLWGRARRPTPLVRYRIRMRLFLRCSAAALLFALGIPGLPAQETKPAAPAAAADTKDKAPEKEPPLPADAHVAQTMQLDGKPLNYTASVGTMPVYDKDGKKSGEVVVTSYLVEGKDRPVTFALNGGPGAASVYL